MSTSVQFFKQNKWGQVDVVIVCHNVVYHYLHCVTWYDICDMLWCKYGVCVSTGVNVSMYLIL